MSQVSTYLHFDGTTEEAFSFYRSVFGTEFSAPITRFKDLPENAGCPPLGESELNKVMHVELPILGGHLLKGNDVPSFLGKLNVGNNVDLALHPDTRVEADRLLAALSVGGKVEMPMQDMFWGDYFGSCVDKFGINWMVICSQKK